MHYEERQVKEAFRLYASLAAQGYGDKEALRQYLGLTPAEFAGKDRETLELLMELKQEIAAEAREDKDATVNTAAWRYLLFPYQWTGYDHPVYIW